MLRVGSVRLALASQRRVVHALSEPATYEATTEGLLQGITDRSETLMSQKPAITRRGNIHRHWESWSVLASSSPGGPVKSTTGARH